jgi:teichuronic acid biosynthesis glycosyltransferase TuaC
VLATPVGVHAQALDGLDGPLCAPYDRHRWRAVAAALLAAPDPRVAGGRERAAAYSSDVMAGRVVDAWQSVLEG